MDFVVGLSESEGYNVIIIYVDRLTKIRYFIAIRNNISAQDTAHLFINNMYTLRGFPKTIVSDYGL